MAEIGLVSGIISLVAFAAKVATSTNEFLDKYKISDLTVHALLTECRSVSLLLDEVRKIIQLGNVSTDGNDDLYQGINDSLYACEVVLKEMDHDIQKFKSLGTGASRLTTTTKFKLVWNEARYAKLKDFMHGYVDYLHLFIGVLNKKSIDEVVRWVRDHKADIDHQVVEAEDLSHGNLTPPADDIDNHEEVHSIFSLSVGRAQSLLSLYGRSMPARSTMTQPISFEGSKQQFVTEQAEFFSALRTKDYPKLENLLGIRGDWFLPARNPEGHTPILMATHNTDLRALQLLTTGLGLEARCSNKNCKGQRPIHVAVGNDDVECLTYLLEHGADAKATNFEAQNALHIAAIEGSTNVIPLLLEKGISLSEEDDHGDHPVHCAIRNRKLSFLEVISTLPIIKEQYGNLFEIANQHGKSPLQLAIEQGWLEGFRFLLSSADPLRKDTIGATLLHNAARCAIVPAIAELRRHGLHFSERDMFGMTPLHHAVLSPYNSEFAALLLESGADIETRSWLDPFRPTSNTHRVDYQPNSDSSYELDKPPHNGESMVGQVFELWETLEAPEEIKSVLKQFRETGSIFAISGSALDKHERILRERYNTLRRNVIEKRIQVRSRPETSGLTPLQLTTLYGNRNTMKMLLQAGADPWATLACGCSLTALARSHEDWHVVQTALACDLYRSREGHIQIATHITLALLVAKDDELTDLNRQITSQMRDQHYDAALNVYSGSGGNCSHGSASFEAFQGFINYCRSTQPPIAGNISYLDQTLVSYLAGKGMSSWLDWLLSSDEESNLEFETKAAYTSFVSKHGSMETPHGVLAVLAKSYGGRVVRAHEVLIDAQNKEKAAQADKEAQQKAAQKRKEAKARSRARRRRRTTTLLLYILYAILVVPELVCLGLYWSRHASLTNIDGNCRTSGCNTEVHKNRVGAVASISIEAGMLLILTLIMIINAKKMRNVEAVPRNRERLDLAEKKIYLDDLSHCIPLVVVHFLLSLSLCFVGMVVCWHKFRISHTNCSNTTDACLSGSYRYLLKIWGSLSTVGLVGFSFGMLIFVGVLIE